MGDGGGKAFPIAELSLSLTVGMLLWWPCHHHKQVQSRDGFLIGGILVIWAA